MANIEINIKSRDSWDILYPKVDLSNTIGTLPITRTSGNIDINSRTTGNLPLSRTTGNLSVNNLTGVLPLAKGGTGVTTIDALKNALGISGGGAKIYKGNYTGSGQAGEDYPNTLTFPFTPIFLIICDTYGRDVDARWIAGCDYFQSEYNGSNSTQCKASLTGNTLKFWHDDWRDPNATYQFNKSGRTYLYVVFG